MSESDRNRRPSRAAVEEQLSKLVCAPQFVKSKRLTAFLRFVVEEALANRGEKIKAYSIAISALGKPVDFDPAHDSSVRVSARQLRLKLLEYFSSDGANDELLITLPVGSYVPVFEHRARLPRPPTAVSQPSSEKPTDRRFERRIRIDVPNQGDASPVWELLKFELAANIGKYPELDVVDSTRPSKTRSSVKVSPEGAADYVLTGASYEANADKCMGFQLVRVLDGVVVWSRRFEWLSETSPATSVRRVALELTVAIAGPAGCIATRDFKELGEVGHTMSASYHALLHVYNYLGDISRQNHLVAYTETKAALRDDPRNGTLWAFLALLHTHELEYRFFVMDDRNLPFVAARRAAQEAIRLDQYNALGWLHLSRLEFAERDLKAFKRHAAKALSLHEHSSYVSVEVGHHLWLCGDVDQGMSLVNGALALHSVPPRQYLFPLVHNHIDRQQFSDAKLLLDQVVMPGFFWVGVLKTAVNAKLGDFGAAKEAARGVDALFPGFLDAIRRSQVSWVFPRGFDDNVVHGVRALN